MTEAMRMFGNLLVSGPFPTPETETTYHIVCLILLIVMLICALVAIIIVLFQPGNSTGIDALGGSSETFFGKNKGRSMESRMKKWTIISLVALAICAIIFFVLQLNGVWGIGG